MDSVATGLVIVAIVVAVIILNVVRGRKKRERDTTGSVWGGTAPSNVGTGPYREQPQPEMAPHPDRTPEPDFEPQPQGRVIAEAELVQQLTAATTTEECVQVWNDAPSGSDIEGQAEQKYAQLIAEQVAAATNLEETWAAINDVHDDFEGMTAVNQAAFEKILTFAADTDEVMELHEALPDDIDSEFVNTVLAKALAVAQDSDDVQKVYDETGEGSEQEKAAIIRRIELATTLDECQAVWEDWDIGHDYWKLAVQHCARLIESGAPTSDDE